MRSVPYAAVAAAVGLLPSSASAADSGGAAAPASNSTQATASTPRGAAPVARIAVPDSPHVGRPLTLTVRFDAPDAGRVLARVVVMRRSDRSVVARLPLGPVPVGQAVDVPWPGSAQLAAGRYLIRVHGADSWNRQLRRPRSARGRATLDLKPRHAPVGAPPASETTAAPNARGTFPVAGPFTFGEGFGAPRPGYSHQGQDMAAAQGTPVVAPLAGTVTATNYQVAAAGEYVVMTAESGQSYFFAHCQRHSTVVTVGQSVARGAMVCRVGSTGRSTGPHLHFEIWVHGWRTDDESRPVDPLPQLEAWTP